MSGRVRASSSTSMSRSSAGSKAAPVNAGVTGSASTTTAPAPTPQARSAAWFRVRLRRLDAPDLEQAEDEGGGAPHADVAVKRAAGRDAAHVRPGGAVWFPYDTTTAVNALVAVPEPTAFVAVTTTSSRVPTSREF